jgi:hypothetical protein
MCAPKLSSAFLRTGHWSALRDKGYGESKMAEKLCSAQFRPGGRVQL